MSNIRSEAATVKWKINSASTAISGLQQDAQRDIGGGVLALHSSLARSASSIEGAVDKHKRRHLSWALIQTPSSKAKSLEKAVNEMMESLDVAVRIANDTHSSSQSYYLKALDLANSHIQPARDAVKSLRGNISFTRRKLESERQSAASKQMVAYERAESARQEIAKKQDNISSIERKTGSNRAEIAQLSQQKARAEQEKNEKSRQARNLRQEAENRRTKGKIFTALTLGLGWPYLAYQFSQADDCENDARLAEQKSSNFASQLSTMQWTTLELERQSNALKQELSFSQASKARLDAAHTTALTRARELESQIRQINQEVEDAQGIHLDAGRMDASIDFLSTRTKLLKQQLLDVKHKLDALKAALEESRDRSLYKTKKGKGLGASREGRKEMVGLLAETGKEMTVLLTEVKKKRDMLQLEY